MQEPQERPRRRGPHGRDRLHRARAGLRDSTRAAGRSWAATRERLSRWDEQQRTTSFVSDSEQVRIDVRRHPFLLALPAARTAAGLAALATDLELGPLLAFALLTGVWALRRSRLGLRRTATVAGAATVGLVVLALMTGPLLCAGLLLLWLVEDVADWYLDRLVVTDKRLYRRHGVLTQHTPSISLTAIAYLDAGVPPLGRLLGYGTLSLDSVAQRDAPLSRFDLVPDVVPVARSILELRSKAMPRFPQSPL